MNICDRTGKECHLDRKKAVAHLMRVKGRGGESSVYRCKHCGFLHVGTRQEATHKKGKQPRRRLR